MQQNLLPFQRRRATVTNGYDGLKTNGLMKHRAAAIVQPIVHWTSKSEVLGWSPISRVYKAADFDEHVREKPKDERPPYF